MHKGSLEKTDMGLRIMRYRANIIGAALSIVSARGRGTTVKCVIPGRSSGGIAS
jgi:signal transduction histidine kinase